MGGTGMFFSGAPGIAFTYGPPPPLQFRQSGVPLPRLLANDVPLGSVFDQGNSMVGTREICWGANVYRPDFYGAWYWPSTRDSDTNHTIDWYKQNHPDWIVFNSDRVTFFQEFYYQNKALVTLDINNPEVREYQRSILAARIAEGYPCIAFDNVELANNGADATHRRHGVWVGSTYDANGNRLTGTWNQLYAGVSNDADYADALIDYIAWMRAEVNALGAALMINGTYQPTDPARMTRLLQSCDIYFSENAPAHGDGTDLTDARWLTFFDVVTPYVQAGGVWFNSQQFIGTNFAGVPNAEKSWMVANFLLMRGQRSYFSADQSSTFRTYDATWLPLVGAPLEVAQAVGSVYQRRYTEGFVAVNPSSSIATTVTVPAGVWTDQFGAGVAPGSHPMAPKSGLVLIAAA